jgi:TonB family protein
MKTYFCFENIISKPIYMKKIFLFVPLILISSLVLSQSEEAKKNYKLGSEALESKKYEKAVSFLTLSIDEFPSANAYYNRAIAYYYLGDSCNFCNGLVDAASLNDKGAENLYREKCMYTTIDKNVPDSLKDCFPPITHLLIERHKCFPDTTIYCVQDSKSYTKTTELSKFRCLTLEEHNKEDIENDVFVVVEEMPEYPGGMGELMKFLGANIRYPASALKAGIQGRVYVNFVVDTDGSIKDVTVLRGIGGGCDEEAIRVVSMMPKWVPGKQKGKEVRVAYNLPVKFSMN